MICLVYRILFLKEQYIFNNIDYSKSQLKTSSSLSSSNASNSSSSVTPTSPNGNNSSTLNGNSPFSPNGNNSATEFTPNGSSSDTPSTSLRRRRATIGVCSTQEDIKSSTVPDPEVTSTNTAPDSSHSTNGVTLAEIKTQMTAFVQAEGSLAAALIRAIDTRCVSTLSHHNNTTHYYPYSTVIPIPVPSLPVLLQTICMFLLLVKGRC